ncbi:hypothetical protein [Lactococcus lactis]|uniref:Extracellular protein n=1 Tax=Lactococcus lactis TaxID=1358 RepID=A0AAW8UJ22_9LACT|nr:hypothetical protein [Lactococcus lactis]MDT2882400.1 hypothetical protein [Lactococcus lactis]MDT2946950.1 hypothetical protein [Lactococcus lactis]
MKKFSKKQIVTSSVILGVLVVGGVSAGVVTHNNNVQAQQVAKTKAHEAKVKADKKAKAKQLAKEKEAAQQKQVATLLATATANPSDNSIKAVNDAIAKLTDQKEKTKDAEMVKGLNNRLALIKKAQAVVKDYQAHAMDANKQKAAQEAINNLKDKNDEDVKAELQKLFDESNNQAQAAAKASQATNQASSEVKEASSSNSSANVNQAANQTQSNANASDSSQGGNYTYQAPANNSQQYVSGNTNSNNSGTASGYASSNTPSGNTNTGGSTSGGTAPSHTGGYGSIADLNQQEKEAGEASNNFPGGW